MTEIEVPVLIVGGGGAASRRRCCCPRKASSRCSSSSLPSTSVMPKAHVLHQRTMEIFREVGVADAVYAAAVRPST